MTYKISDVVNFSGSGGTPSRKNKEYYEKGTIPWLKTKELNDSKIFTTEEKITEEGYKNSSAKRFPVNTVTIAMYGATVGKLGILKQEMATNQACCNIVVDPKKCDYRFLFYYLKYNRKELVSLANGAAQQNLNQSTILNFPFPNIELEEQVLIADILSSFDDKIENNNNIIANLEEQAQTIFKSWFVDFEPFQKEEFIDNTIGLIPTSFESISLGELYKLRSGYAFKSKDWTDKGFPVIKIKDIQPPTIDLNNIDYVNDMNVIEKAVDFKVCGGEIVMALTGATTGKIGIIPDINEAYVNQRVGLFLDSTESGYGYLYGLLNQEQFISKVIELAQGSAQANLSPRDVNNLLVPYNKNAFEKYNSLINPMMSHIALILNENQSLRETRDTLLPKLMSGEIRVEDTIEVEEM